MAHRLLPSAHVRRPWCVVGWLVVVGLVAVVTASVVVGAPLAREEGRRNAPVPPVARSAGAVMIQDVQIVTRPAPAVRVRLSRPVELRARTLRPERGAPPRIYVDVAGAALDPRVRRHIAGADPIVRVRSGQFDPSTARIIIDLARETSFAVVREGRIATISIGGAPAGRAAETAASKPKAAAKRSAAHRPPSPVKVNVAAPPVSAPRVAVAETVAVAAAPSAAAPPAPDPAAPAAAPPAPPAESAAAAPAEPAAEPGALPRMTRIGGVLFAWPALGAPAYDAPDAEPFRRAIEAWQSGAPPADAASPGTPSSPAALYLAADAALLEAAAGRQPYIAAADAYEHALREAPDFPDAARGHFMLGQADLALGFGPEASGAFATLERRFPESPLLPDALLGEAASLRLRHRVGEARVVVDRAVASASGEVLCRARAAQGATAATPAAAVDAYRRLVEACPHALEDPVVLLGYAESLEQARDRDAAWRLVTAPRDATAGDDEARLHLFAGRIAPDPDAARAEYDRVLGMKISPDVALEAEMRLALLDADDDPEKAAAALLALADRPGGVALRATILGEAAEATARAGRFEEALRVLDRAAALGPDAAQEVDAHRATVFRSWIASFAPRNDDAGIATVYAAYTTLLQQVAAPEDRITIAAALGRLGLHEPAMRILAPTVGREPDPEAAVMLAEEAVAAGDPETARSVPARLRRTALSALLTSRLHAAMARAALLTGDVDAAAAEASATGDPELRAVVATALLARPGGATAARSLLEPTLAGAKEPPVHVLLVAGAAALEDRAWEPAASAYGRALARGAAGAERAEAAAGLVRAARARGDATAVADALAEIAKVGTLDRKVVARVAAAGKDGTNGRGR